MNIFGQKICVEYSEDKKALLVINEDLDVNSGVLIDIEIETLSAMTFDEAAEFLGKRVLLLIPEMRDLFKQYLKD